MLEELRRDIAHRREEKEKAKLKEIEVQRRLSVIRTKRIEARKFAEEELRVQRKAEMTSLTQAQQALVERKRAEKELRQMTPGLGRRMARGARKVFYDVPVKTVKALSEPTAGAKARRLILGDPTIFLGRTKPEQPTQKKPEQSVEEFLYGKPSGDKGKDILS